MRVYKQTMHDAEAIATTNNSDAYQLESIYGYAVQLSFVVATPAATTFDSATFEVQTLTFPTFAGCTDRDYIVVENAAGVKFAVYADKTGSSAAPTGALYAAANYKVKANISTDTTAAQVAARFETAFNTLTGFTASITSDDTAANGTMLLTQVVAGPTVNPVPKNQNDSGAGSISGVQNTAGLVSEINLTDNTMTIPSHGYATGLKAALTGVTLPDPLTATDYWVIVVDSNTIKLATSAALALAGTAVDLTTEGTGVHTLTPAALSACTSKLQGTNYDCKDPNVTPVWTDLANPQTITVTGNYLWNNADTFYSFVRLSTTMTTGQITLTAKLNAKGV